MPTSARFNIFKMGRYMKKLKAFISLVCIASFLISFLTIPVAAENSKSVTATTSASLKQGNSGTLYVYIDSTEGLAALDVTVHFDSSKIKVNSVYNRLSCLVYDSVKNDDSVQFSYILDGKGSASKTTLFYFGYQVLSDAKIGDTYFDVSIGEAYDSGLNDISVSGTRCKLNIAETVTNKTCSVYSTSTISTSVEQEFTLNYSFSTYQIASGTAVINYDAECFEVLEVTSGKFLTNKIVDINTQLSGSVYISFVGTEYYSDKNFIAVKFKTIKNVTEASKITFTATELCDKKLNAISCSSYTTTININYDDSYIKDAPKMYLSAEYNKQSGKLEAKVFLEPNSKLGAGDFTIKFDPSLLTLNTYEKGFTPTFFNINEKEINEGILKFSIISLEDIVDEKLVLTLIFDVAPINSEQTTLIDISGSMLSDSLTNTIKLNLLDTVVNLPRQFTKGDLNGDDSLNILDLVRLKKILAGIEVDYFATPDLDGDGEVTAKDLTILMDFILADYKK